MPVIAPRILGALLDGVVSAHANYHSVTLEKLPRMADFARWVVAAEAGLGWQRGTFIAAYEAHRQSVERDAMDRDPVARLIPTIPDLGSSSEWSGSPTALLRLLVALSDEAQWRAPEWPKAPNALSAHLRRVVPVLRANGYEVTTDRTSTERKVTIRRAASSSSSSPSSAGPTAKIQPDTTSTGDERDGDDDV